VHLEDAGDPVRVVGVLLDLPGAAAPCHLAIGVRGPGTDVARERLLEREPDEPLVVDAQHLRRFGVVVDEDEASVGLESVHVRAEGGVVHDRLQAVLPLRAGELRLFAVGDVLHEAGERDHVPGGVEG